MSKITEQEILFVVNLKQSKPDLGWQDIAEAFEKKFKVKKSYDAIRMMYNRYSEMYSDNEAYVKNLRETVSSKKRASAVAKENLRILEAWQSRSDILDAIKEVVNKSSRVKIPPIKKKKKDKGKRNMTLELMLSDIHYGKKTDNVDNEEIRRRVRKTAQVTLDEIERESKVYNVEKIIISLIGDIIESSHFHGAESEKGSEFGSSRQVFEAIQSIYEDVIVPLATTGLDIEVLAVTGNHDRLTADKTYSNPGEDNLTYIIYKTLEMMAKRDKLVNIQWNIPKGLYTHTEVYGNILFIEHGDELKNLNRDTVFNMIAKRQNQIGKIIDFYRFGHWHEVVAYSRGKAIGNGSVPGQDSYAEAKGFTSEAIQVLNYYVETKNRPTCFFRSFPIYLDLKGAKK